jgi:hypothetical protein
MWRPNIAFTRAGYRNTALRYSVVTILTELSRLELKLRKGGNKTESKPEKASKKERRVE